MIGIAGGVGPFAGFDLLQKVQQETIAGRDQEHLPVVLISEPHQIPDRTEYLIGKEKENPAYAISRIMLKLEGAGATIAAIPCNTAHAPRIFDVIREELAKSGSRLKLVNMIDEVVLYANTKYPDKNVGVLCTTGTRRAGVYRDAFQRSGIKISEPDDAWQEKVHDAIYHPEYGIKSASPPVTDKARSILLEAAGKLINDGAEVIVLGCTEIPLAIPESTIGGVPLIDANRVLARALVYNEVPEKLRNANKNASSTSLKRHL